MRADRFPLTPSQPVFSALQTACLEPLERLRERLERVEEGAPEGSNAQALGELAQLRHFVEKTVSGML